MKEFYGPQPEPGTEWGAWRRHPGLRGLFHTECPDDLQVVVHDGGPRMSTHPGELVWVRITGVQGDVFRGQLLNQPHNLKSVRLGETIQFVVPTGGKHPLMVTEKYLRERANWVVHPCSKCGLSELFDAPSDLISKIFPDIPADAKLGMFTTFCPLCGGVQGAELHGFDREDGAPRTSRRHQRKSGGSSGSEIECCLDAARSHLRANKVQSSPDSRDPRSEPKPDHAGNGENTTLADRSGEGVPMHSTCTGRRFTRTHRFHSVLCGVFAIVCLAIGPAAFAQPPSPQRYIPAKGLVAYLEFDGLRHHADSWKKTAAFALLADTPAGWMMSEVARQVLDELLKLNAGGKLTGADLLALHEHLMQHGVVIAVHDCGNESYSTTIVLKNAGDQVIRQPLDRLTGWMMAGQEAGKRPAAIKLRGRDVYGRLPKAPPRDREGFPAVGVGGPESAPVLTCQSAWYEGGDLVLIIGPDAVFEDMIDPEKEKELGSAHLKHRAAVLDSIEGKQPDVTTHAAYISTLAEGKDIKGFVADGLFFADAGTAVGLLVGGSDRSSLGTERIRAEVAAVYAKRERLRRSPASSFDQLVPSQPHGRTCQWRER